MEEQPVALATIILSPYSCDNNFTYGVSPQPEQAPENSNSGCNNCVPFTVFLFTRARSISGSDKKKFQFLISISLIGICETMLIALWPGCALLSTGQYSTHKLQPVQ